MGTNKKEIKVYLGLEVYEDFQVLYEIWSIKCKKRGILPNRNKFIEGIIGDYVKGAKEVYIQRARDGFVKG